MKQYAALLRGVNVGGHNLVPMADLRRLALDLGLDDPRTLLQSGNLVFGSPSRSVATLGRALEAAIQERFGIEVVVIVRTADDLRTVIARNPFLDAAQRDPGHLIVMFLQSAPKPAGVEALQGAITGTEITRVDGRHAYIVYPDGIGRSRLVGTLVERALGTRGTARNWNTVLKLAELTGT
jgi:uncharacterized protein (DUF1697 family)